MKIRLISDLHVDINEEYPIELKDKDSFTLVAGDTGGELDMAKEWLKNNVHNGIIVAGNHIVYNYDGKTVKEIKNDLRKEFPKEGSLSFLENDYKIINDIVFIGCTLYSDFKLYDNPKLCKFKSLQGMNDYRFGLTEDENGSVRSITPDDYEKWFNESVKYIDDICNKFKDKEIVVVTHFGPSAKSIPIIYSNDMRSASYSSNLEDFIRNHSNIKLWFHGHSHESSGYEIGNTKVILNPRGYERYHESDGWTPNVFVDSDNWEVIYDSK